MIKRISICAVALLLLAGCADPTETVQPKGDTVEPQGDQQIFVQKIEVNGRLVSCVVFTGYKKGGVSCDFTREAKP